MTKTLITNVKGPAGPQGPAGSFDTTMTTVGDMVVEGAGPAAARLAGNTTALRKFLMSQGTGSAATVPSWDQLQASDFPGMLVLPLTFTFGSSGAVPSSGTYVTGQVAVDQNNVIRVCTAGGAPGTWSRAGQKPWEFYADDYGAKGDGKIFVGGSGLSGTNTFSDSTNSPFVSGDTGKLVVANQGAAGANTTAPFTGTITYVNAGSVTLSGNLSADATNCPYVYGSDDAAAITNCVNAAAAYALSSGNPEVDIIFSNRHYLLGALTQTKTGVSGAVLTYNSHVPVPVALQKDKSLTLNVKVSSGPGTSPGAAYWETTMPNLQGGSLISAITPPSQPDVNYGWMSIFGGPSDGDSSHYGLGGFGNVQINYDGPTIVTPWKSLIRGVDGRNVAKMVVPDGRATTFAPVNLEADSIGGPWLGNLSDVQLPANGAIAFAFPRSANNANAFAGRISSTGIAIGVQAGEHFNAQELTLLYCDRPYQIDMQGFGPTTHGHTIGKITAEVSNHGIDVINGGSGQSVPIIVGLLDMENIFVDHISDPTNSLNGYVNVSNVSASRPVVNGGEQIIVTDVLKHGPGPWSGAPAAPSSATPQQNLSYRYATITLTATTITSVSKGRDSSGMTAITGLAQAASGPGVVIRVPPGHWWEASYTGVLTATWELD